MNHFAPKSHLQPSNNSWSWKFLQLKLGFQMFPVSSGYLWQFVTRSFASHPSLLLGAKSPGSDMSINHVLFGMTWLLSSSIFIICGTSQIHWLMVIYH